MGHPVTSSAACLQLRLEAMLHQQWTLKFTAKKTQTQKKPGSKVTTQTRVVQPNSWSTCQWMGQAYEWIAQAQRDKRASRANRHRAWEQRCLGAINRSTLTDWMSTQQQTRKLGDRPSAWAAGAGSYCDVTRQLDSWHTYTRTHRV